MHDMYDTRMKQLGKQDIDSLPNFFYQKQKNQPNKSGKCYYLDSKLLSQDDNKSLENKYLYKRFIIYE